MTPQYVIHLGQQAIVLMLMISAPRLLAGLMIGLGVSILQAVTQIQEMTLTFVPKLIAMALAAAFFMPWIMQRITSFAQLMFGPMEIP